MKGRTKVLTLLFWVTAGLVVAISLVWLVRVMVSSPVAKASVNFEAIERTGKANDYLVYPHGSSSSVPDEFSPVFEVPVMQLRREWIAVVGRQPRTTWSQGGDDPQIQFVQRSRLMNFPDLITVRFYDLGENRSTLAIYSRSLYGYYDLGANRRRIKSWLLELERRVSRKKSWRKQTPELNATGLLPKSD